MWTYPVYGSKWILFNRDRHELVSIQTILCPTTSDIFFHFLCGTENLLIMNIKILWVITRYSLTTYYKIIMEDDTKTIFAFVISFWHIMIFFGILLIFTVTVSTRLLLLFQEIHRLDKRIQLRQIIKICIITSSYNKISNGQKSYEYNDVKRYNFSPVFS